MNRYEKLFEEWMDLTEFSLIKHIDEDGEDEGGIWSLIDRQGGNLGDIESDRFDNASQIFDRMGIYIDDYILRDLESEADAYGVVLPDDIADDEGHVYWYWECAYWVWYRKQDGHTKEELKFIEEHKFEFDLCELIAYHANEIDLNNCYHEED